jgi:hypothetical protein
LKPERADRKAKSDTEIVAELGPAGLDDGPDQLLDHYTRAGTALEHILPNGTLMMNPYSAMRDPLENKELSLMLRYSGGSSGDLIPLSDARAILDDLRGQMRILSLTMDIKGFADERTRSFARGYARLRMWE